MFTATSLKAFLSVFDRNAATRMARDAVPAGGGRDRRNQPLRTAAHWLAPCIAAATLCAGPGRAASPDAPAADPAKAKRTRIGLVLSGGGARGIAHIGVLKVLRDLQVPIDCITGTSMGGIVGAIYATGMPVDEMETAVKAIDWKEVLKDRPNRRLMTERRKEEESGYLARPELGYRDGAFQFPGGVLYGQNIEQLFGELASRGEGVSDFTRLPYPFKAVATDIETGTPYVLDKGSLPKAMRATMSVPGAMAPAEIDGRRLLDGGLVQNLPVALARELCADVVIAVNLGTPLLKGSQLDSLFSVSAQMVNILTEQNVRASLAQLGPKDILISPELGDITAGSFDRADGAIEAGEQAALKREAQLRELSLPPAQYLARLQDRRSVPEKSYRIDEVRIAPMKRTNPASLAGELETRPGTEATRTEIERDVQRIYSRGDFESVGIDMLRDGDRNVALFEPREKSWGPHYLRFGLSLTATGASDAGFTIVARSNQTALNAAGAQWLNQVQVGRVAALLSEFYQPLAAGSRWYLAPRITLMRRSNNLFLGDTDIALYRTSRTTAGLDLGHYFGRLGEMRVGLIAGREDSHMDIGLPILPDSSSRIGGWTARLDVDKLDSANFPTEGQRLRFDMIGSRTDLGADTSYTRAQIDWTAARTWGNNTFTMTASLGHGVGSGPIPLFDSFSLGGFLRLSGYGLDRFRAQGIAFGSLGYRRVISPPLGLQLGGLLDRMYAGGSLEAGRLYDSFDPLTPDGNYYSGSVYIGAETLIGPTFLGIGYGGRGEYALWLAIGRPWVPR